MNTFLNGLITGLILAIILRSVIYMIAQWYKKETVLGPKEFDFTFDPVYTRHKLSTSQRTSSNVSATLNPLNVKSPISVKDHAKKVEDI